MNVLVTGGAGFIGCNFVHLLLAERPDWRIVCLDALTYAGNLANLEAARDQANFRFVKGDICDAAVAGELMADIDAVVNFAAESHVDRSILGCQEFIRTNIQGTQVLLDAARRASVRRFVQVSTDEVYGSLGAEGRFTEQTPLAPNSPYSASKAAADMLVQAYHHTYGFATLITRCSNNYGPYQFPEKLIPLFVTNLLADKKVPVYGDGQNVRDWLHVSDHCRAVLCVLEQGPPGAVYNIGGNNERANIEITKKLIELLGKDESLMEFVPDRLGHDRRYAIDAGKIQRELGWEPRIDFAQGLKNTIQWYIDHEPWWQAIKSGDYRQYYQRQYGTAL
ncbi:MAG: dTDP-glucose 4,6-dehydratase [Sedimentisphaerales bacterium]|nr:dTDP-glucose 4,6-dehydratase [Sedimentisphaerales bacterium]